jgi:Resolvase, N terminal domain
LQAVAKRHGWEVITVYTDQGISGAKGRDVRPGLDRLMQAVTRREINMVATWSVDRLGRSLTHLLAVLQDLHAKSVDLYLHQQGLDTSTPSGRAVFQMLGVFAEFERADPRTCHGRAGPGKGRRNAARATCNHRGRRGQSPNDPRSPRRGQEHPDHCTRASSGHRDGFAPYGIERRPRRENNPLAPPDRTSAGGRIALRQNLFAPNLRRWSDCYSS